MMFVCLVLSSGGREQNKRYPMYKHGTEPAKRKFTTGHIFCCVDFGLLKLKAHSQILLRWWARGPHPEEGENGLKPSCLLRTRSPTFDQVAAAYTICGRRLIKG